MNIKEILRLKTLIEIYDRELNGQIWFHSRKLCKRCQSLIKQRNEMIVKLKKEKEK